MHRPTLNLSIGLAFNLSLLALASGVSWGEELRIEDFRASDYQRSYLSLVPKLNIGSNPSENDFNYSYHESGRAERFGSLGIRFGSTDYARNSSLKLSLGADFNSNAWGNNDKSKTINEFGLMNSRASGNNWTYGFQSTQFARLQYRRYWRGDFFLAPSAEGDGSISPSEIYRSEFERMDPQYSFAGPIQIQYSQSRNIKSNANFSGIFRLALGYGRLEEIGFAETALFMLDRLEQVTGKAINFDVQALEKLQAFVEARRKLRSFYDSRQGSIYDIESVCQFLREKMDLQEIPSLAVLAMADEWQQTPFTNRTSGWEVQAFPYLKVDFQGWKSRSSQKLFDSTLLGNSKIDLDSLVQNHSFSPDERRQTRESSYSRQANAGIGFRANWAKPWRRFFQFETELIGRSALVMQAGEYRLATGTEENPIGPDHSHNYMQYPLYDASCKAKIGWRPNSRTQIETSIQGSLTYKGDVLEQSNPIRTPTGDRFLIQDVLTKTASAWIQGKYWIQPRLSFQGGFSLNLNQVESHDEVPTNFSAFNSYIENQNNHQTSFNLNFGLEYYLF